MFWEISHSEDIAGDGDIMLTFLSAKLFVLLLSRYPIIFLSKSFQLDSITFDF